MKSFFDIFRFFALGVCLTLYGNGVSAAVMARGDMLTVVICADGVTKTVTLNADGLPAEPQSLHCDCLDCCHGAVGGLVGPTDTQARMPRIVDVDLHWHAADTVFSQTKLRPMPRGPPQPSCDLTQSAIGGRNFMDAAA